MAEFSLIKFFQQFPTEEKATEYFEKLRWGEVIICPYCGSVHISCHIDVEIAENILV